MNYARRRRYYRSRYPSRSYRRTYSTASRSTRRAIGNYRAASQQKDSTQVNLSIPSIVSVFSGETAYVNEEGTAATMHNGVAAINIFDVLRRSEFYQSYASMYDQMKIDSIRVKLTPYSFPIIGNSSIGELYRSYTVVTAWDRSGLSDTQCLIVNKEANEGSQANEYIGNVDPVTGDSTDTNGLYIMLDGDVISTYSSAITKNVNPNSNSSIVRRLYPSSLQEKSQYVNTADLKEWYKKYDTEKGRYIGIPNFEGVLSSKRITVEDTSNIEQSGVAITPLTTIFDPTIVKNPSYIEESPSLPFKPTLLVGIKNEPIQVSDTEVKPSMVFTAEYDIGVTFRGLRKANIV